MDEAVKSLQAIESMFRTSVYVPLCVLFCILILVLMVAAFIGIAGIITYFKDFDRYKDIVVEKPEDENDQHV